MKRFAGTEIRSFLKVVDRHVDRPAKLVIIGGAAAALSLGSKFGTTDIGTANKTAAIESACQEARKESGLQIPLGMASVFQTPYEYEKRLVPLSIPGLKNLHVLVPEKHDWALMKITRLLEKDISHILDVSKTVGFNKKVFLDRFIKEMNHIEPSKPLIADFLAMMEELYGDKEADRMEAEIRKKWKC
jgi:hypothetical protein